MIIDSCFKNIDEESSGFFSVLIKAGSNQKQTEADNLLSLPVIAFGNEVLVLYTYEMDLFKAWTSYMLTTNFLFDATIQ